MNEAYRDLKAIQLLEKQFPDQKREKPPRLNHALQIRNAVLIAPAARDGEQLNHNAAAYHYQRGRAELNQSWNE
jgi:hypothetical protein